MVGEPVLGLVSNHHYINRSDVICGVEKTHQSILMHFEGGQQLTTNAALRHDGRFYTLQEQTL